MQINYILLGQRIRAIRTKKGISQMELAERVNRSAAYMSYVETAYKFCSLDTLVRVANALNAQHTCVRSVISHFASAKYFTKKQTDGDCPTSTEPAGENVGR